MTREKQIKKQANIYIGHPQDLEEDICITNMRNDFIEGAKWGDKTMIEKAYKWLCANMVDSTYLGANTLIALNKAEFIQNFKHAMEE